MDKHVLKKGWYDFKSKHKYPPPGYSDDREAYYAGVEIVILEVLKAAKDGNHDEFAAVFNNMVIELAVEKES